MTLLTWINMYLACGVLLMEFIVRQRVARGLDMRRWQATYLLGVFIWAPVFVIAMIEKMVRRMR